MLLELSYVCMPTFIVTIANMGQLYLDRLPEAISCCLQTYTVIDVLLIMYCMCLPAFFVTSTIIIYRTSSNSSRLSNRPRRNERNTARPQIERTVLLKLTQSEQDQAKCCLVGHVYCRSIAGKPGTVVYRL